MIKNKKIFTIVMLLALSIACFELNADETDYRRPDFSIADLNGVDRSISEWDGNAVLINFWASWCIPCKREIPMLNQLSADHADKDFQILGIAVDTADNIREFIKTTPLDYLTLADEDKSQDVANQFSNSFLVLPFTVFLDHEGRIFWMQVEEMHRNQVDAVLDRIWQIETGELDYDQAQQALVADLEHIMQSRMPE